MTKEQLFQRMIEDDLFKDINQTKNVVDFILARTAAFSASDASDEYRELQQQKQQYEAEFKSFYEDQDGGENRFSKYLDIAEEAAATSEFLHFMKGFFEGAKFFLVMILVCGDYDEKSLSH